MQGKAHRLARPAAPLAACVQRTSCAFYSTLSPSTEYHRNSIVCDGPRDAICRSKFYQLLRYCRNKSLQQIEVMELQLYGRPTCNKLSESSHYASTGIDVISKLDAVDFFDDESIRQRKSEDKQ